MATSHKSLSLKHAVIDLYREQMRLRYMPENCRRFKELKPIRTRNSGVARLFSRAVSVVGEP